MLEKIFNRDKTTTDKNLFNILKLIRSENVGPKTFFSLVKYFGSEEAAINALPELARRGGRSKKIKVIEDALVYKEIESTHKYGAKFLCYNDSDYPPLLKEIHNPPPVLITLGNTNLLKRSGVGIVGSRNASINGMAITKKFTKSIAGNNFVIVSGMARGIDKSSHEASIDSGTIAVMAGGINNIYPIEHESLYNEIAEKGLIITEIPFGIAPVSKNFPLRNRLISGLSIAVVVIEASIKSGSLITAKYALEQNREIFAIPGCPLDPRSQGPNRLIKEGAYLVESADDLLENLARIQQCSMMFSVQEQHDNVYIMPNNTMPSEKETKKAREEIIKLLSFMPVNLEDIIKKLDIAIPIVYLAILELEIAGKIIRYPGDNFILNINNYD